MVRKSRKRYQTRHLDLFYCFLRDQAVDGSNPFAATTLSIPASHWLTLLSLCFRSCDVMWTNVDQLKAQTDALRPFLLERNIIFQFRIQISDLFLRMPHPEAFQVLWNGLLSEPSQTKASKSIKANPDPHQSLIRVRNSLIPLSPL